MHKKLFSISIVAVFAVVASFAIVGTASAAEFGNCLTAKAGGEGTTGTCGTTHVFNPYPGIVGGKPTYEAVTTKKAGSTGNFILANEATPANGIECTALKGEGIVVNAIAPNGFTEQALTFTGCKGLGALSFCQSVVAGVAQKIDGTGELTGKITAEAISKTEQELTPTGFNVACSGGENASPKMEITVELGGVTGKIVGHTVPAKPYELEFNKAKGEVFAGEASTQTGTSETAEAFKPTGKVYTK